jgi:hypothetical protein
MIAKVKKLAFFIIFVYEIYKISKILYQNIF